MIGEKGRGDSLTRRSRIEHVLPWNLSLDDFGKNGVQSE